MMNVKNYLRVVMNRKCLIY